jgi:Ca-activated chloride channel family protein
MLPRVCGGLAVSLMAVAGVTDVAALGQPERAARAGMSAYRAGDFETATNAFANAAELRPGHAKLLYNAGAAAYRLGSHGAARRLLQAAINSAAGDQLAVAGHLAVGHSWMAEAEQEDQADPAAAMPALEAAIKSYERTLRLDGDHEQAAYHLERARTMLDELRQQMEQERGTGQDPPGDGEDQQQQQQQDGQESEQQDGGADEENDQQREEQGQEQQQQAPSQDPGQQDAGMRQETADEPSSDQEADAEADALARQIIAAEEELAAMLERHRQEMEPVARDW